MLNRNGDFLIPVPATEAVFIFYPVIVLSLRIALSLEQGSDATFPPESNSSDCAKHMLSLALPEWPNESFVYLPCKEEEMLWRRQRNQEINPGLLLAG